MDAGDVPSNKTHRPRQAGAKADKRKANLIKKKTAEAEESGKGKPANVKNHKAFGVAKYGRLHKSMQRNRDISHRKEHAPLVDRTPVVPPPVMVVVMGPPGSGKSTLIKVSGMLGSCRRASGAFRLLSMPSRCWLRRVPAHAS